MNLVFHTLISISTSSICAKEIDEGGTPLKYMALGVAGNIVGHGIMDLIPHNYPLTMITDGLTSFAIFLFSIAFIKRRFLSTVSICFLGGIIPDLIDKVIFRMIMANNLKIFPWHWPKVINFFYEWYFEYAVLFDIFNIIVIVLSVLILFLNRKFIFNHMIRAGRNLSKK